MRYFRSDERSASAGRNIGIREARGEILLFLDDDVIIDDPEFLQKHVRHYADPTVPGVVGCSLEQSANQKVRYHRHWMSRRTDVGWLYFPANYGCFCKLAVGRSNNLSVRRKIAIDVGGMDENYVKGAHREEADFCLRVVEQYGTFIFDPEALLIHIGNVKGGIRSWNEDILVKAQHHFDGAMYLLHKMVPFRSLPDHLFATLFFFFYDKNLWKRPHLLLITGWRLLKGIRNGWLLKRRGPKYLQIK